MNNTYPVGQAPWETGQNSYPVGQAPWEQSSPQSAPSGIGQGIANTAGGVLKNIASAPVTAATRLGQLGGVGIAGLASKVTGNPSYYQNATQALDQPSSFAGIPVKPLNQETPESIAGEGLSTVSLGVPGGSGALTGALAGAGNAMQNNESPTDVGINAGAGGLLGYGTGLLGSSIMNHFNAPQTIEDFLTQSGVSDEASAPQIADQFRTVGVGDLSSPKDVIIAKNVIGQNMQEANRYLTNASTDPITGELDEAGQRWSSRLDMLKNLNSMLPGIGRYVNAIAPSLGKIGAGGAVGLLGAGQFLGNIGGNLASTIGKDFLGQVPNFISSPSNQ